MDGICNYIRSISVNRRHVQRRRQSDFHASTSPLCDDRSCFIGPQFDLVRQFLPLGAAGRDLHRILFLPCRPCHRTLGRVDDLVVHLRKTFRRWIRCQAIPWLRRGGGGNDDGRSTGMFRGPQTAPSPYCDPAIVIRPTPRSIVIVVPKGCDSRWSLSRMRAPVVLSAICGTPRPAPVALTPRSTG